MSNNNNNIKLVLWNSRGIRNKLIEFFDFLIRNNVDIALVSETWLKSNMVMSHSEYCCYRKDRESAAGGGVAIIIRKSINHTTLPYINTEVIENIGVRVVLGDNSHLNIYSCYFPGGSAGPSQIRKQKFKSDLSKLSRNQEKYILGGDFNSRNQNWGCLRANCWGNILNDLITTNAFHIVYPPEPTLVPSNINSNPSVLDFFITNAPEKFSAAITGNNLSSDHLPVFATYDSSYDLRLNYTFNYKSTNWKDFKKYINDNILRFFRLPLNTKDDIDDFVNEFTLFLQIAIDVCVPKRLKTNYFVKKLPKCILNLIRLRNTSRRNWIRYRLTHFKAEINFLNKIIKERVFQFRNNSWNHMLKSLRKASTKMWNISKILKRKGSCIPCLKDNGIIYTTNLQKADVLAQQFLGNHHISSNLGSTSFTNEVRNSMNILNTYDSDHPVISVNTIKNIIKSSKNKSSPGIDGIPNLILKNLPAKGFEILALLFNACLKIGYFPLAWKRSKTVPIPKPGKINSQPASYRPISLLNTMSKVLEKCLKEIIVDFIESSNILPPQQYGFREEHNTVQPLVRIKKLVKQNFIEGKSTAMVLLDVKAAFDSVWHDGLVYKLIKLGLNLSIVKIVKSFLTDRSFRVHIGIVTSDTYCIPAGCPQGSCISPILYNLYTHDFPYLSCCDASMFADDTAILSSNIYAADILSDLQDSVNNVVEYFNKWKIMINPLKSQSIFFTRRRKSCFVPQTKIKINGLEVEWETTVRYLGVVLDNKLLFNAHISYVINRLNLTTKTLYAFINRKSKLNIENKLLIFKVVFHSILFYAAPAWHNTSECHIKRLQVSQNKILKMMYNLPNYYSTLRLHSLHNIPFVKDKIHFITNKFFNKCSYSRYDHIKSICP